MLVGGFAALWSDCVTDDWADLLLQNEAKQDY